jgi:ABC-2 type transport system ATP-binding protein
VNGFDAAIRPDEVRRAIGIVFQDPSLDSDLTAWENMELHGVLYDVPRALRHARITQLLQFVELLDRKDDFVKNFSGGMRRRLEVARCLLHEPSVVFLDEPTLGLDVQTRNHMWAYLRERNKAERTTIFFTTHYLEEAEKTAHRIGIIDHGKIVALGTTAELKEQTSAASLEDAFLTLTGKSVRKDSADARDELRLVLKAGAR